MKPENVRYALTRRSENIWIPAFAGMTARKLAVDWAELTANPFVFDYAGRQLLLLLRAGEEIFVEEEV